MSFIIKFLLIKLFEDFCFNNFNILEKSVSWFLVEHVFEQYNLTSGKFFIINEDFRRLITNFLKIVRDLTYWPYVITITEFFSLIFTVCYLVYLGVIDFYSKLSTKVKYTFKDFVYYLFISAFIAEIHYRYTKFDVLFVLRPLGIWFDCVCVLFYVYLFCFILYNYVFYYNSNFSTQLYIKYPVIKSYFYLMCLFSTLYSVYFISFFENATSNNFIQELALNIIFVYTYIYYFFNYINL